MRIRDKPILVDVDFYGMADWKPNELMCVFVYTLYKDSSVQSGVGLCAGCLCVSWVLLIMMMVMMMFTWGIEKRWKKAQTSSAKKTHEPSQRRSQFIVQTPNHKLYPLFIIQFVNLCIRSTQVWKSQIKYSNNSNTIYAWRIPNALFCCSRRLCVPELFSAVCRSNADQIIHSTTVCHDFNLRVHLHLFHISKLLIPLWIHALYTCLYANAAGPIGYGAFDVW